VKAGILPASCLSAARTWILSMDDLFKGRHFEREIIIYNDLQTSGLGIANNDMTESH
jgi:hypothetical protein